MKTIGAFAKEVNRTTSAVLKMAKSKGVPLQKARSPDSGQVLVVLDAAAERALLKFYPKILAPSKS
ncbi:MAG: hypothetical protein IPN11_14245 [Opitutaceae bacterium]|nr:hypothetical protein [Opitutaceae bacterium]